MIVLVTGGRFFTDRDRLFAALDALDPRPTFIIEGGQRRYLAGEIVGGADYWAMRWAKDRGVPYRTFAAKWHDLETPPMKIKKRPDGSLYNALAGFVRNKTMIETQPNLVVAAPGGRGTADCVNRARSAGIEVREIK